MFQCQHCSNLIDATFHRFSRKTEWITQLLNSDNVCRASSGYTACPKYTVVEENKLKKLKVCLIGSILQVEEVSMHKNCHTTKSFLSVTLPYRCHLKVQPTTLSGLTSSSCRGLRPSGKAFFLLLAQKELFTLFMLILGHFWCSVVTSVIFVVT